MIWSALFFLDVPQACNYYCLLLLHAPYRRSSKFDVMTINATVMCDRVVSVQHAIAMPLSLSQEGPSNAGRELQLLTQTFELFRNPTNRDGKDKSHAINYGTR